MITIKGDKIHCEGWAPVLFGVKHDELFSTKKLALERGRQILAMMNLSPKERKRASVSAVWEEGEFSWDDVSEYVSREDFENAK